MKYTLLTPELEKLVLDDLINHNLGKKELNIKYGLSKFRIL